MKKYRQFVNLLESELQSFQEKPKNEWKETALKYVDGFAADELRRLITLKKRRKDGTFFTHSELASKVLFLSKLKFTKESVIYDPACGASNLLIAVADYVRKQTGIKNFETNLLGTDKHEEFIEASRLRLQMNQLIYGAPSSSANNKFGKNIIVADGLLKNEFYQKATHIVVNPPFNQITPANKLTWAKGKVSAAALFIEKIVENVNADVSIIAILPDVLRSGTRYEKWRLLVQKKCVIEKIVLLGQFDKYADVDVFALKLRKRKKNIIVNSLDKKWQSNKSPKTQTLSNLFDICVGPVVDNRDPYEGESLGYILSKGLEGWSVKKEANHTRRHKGKSFKSPFVVIKRTSRMNDKHRATATIINVSLPVYVDNHLIILKPKSGKVSTCKDILKLLKNKQTDDWLNSQIRCRHLTVKVVSKIPFGKQQPIQR